MYISSFRIGELGWSRYDSAKSEMVWNICGLRSARCMSVSTASTALCSGAKDSMAMKLEKCCSMNAVSEMRDAFEKSIASQ